MRIGTVKYCGPRFMLSFVEANGSTVRIFVGTCISQSERKEGEITHLWSTLLKEKLVE